ncbi:MAG: hypothetical protein HOD85_09250 [Deltaproteobacteria bacterium]|nr:hypothetical protein [Deltaproteobacteria bacterium]
MMSSQNFESPRFERILISNPKTYVPEFRIIELSYIPEVKQDMQNLDIWSFEVHLYDGRVRVLSMEDKQDAYELHSRFFKQLAVDRK